LFSLSKKFLFGMEYCMDVSTLGPCLLMSQILSEKCSSMNCSGGDWFMLCQLMEMIVLVVCKCRWCLLLIHFCGQDGEFFLVLDAVQIMKFFLKKLRYCYFPVFPINRPAAASHLRAVHGYITVTCTLRLARLMILMVVWVVTQLRDMMRCY
jgi:hypothetical protein